MKGTTQFRRKDQEMFLDKFRVVAVTTLEPSQFEYFSKHPIWQVVGVLSLFAVTYFFKADYGYMGFAAILAMYLLRKQAVARAVVGMCLFGTTWRAGMAFIPIGLYNGERGFIKGKIGKYICYAFYPLHMLALGILKYVVYGIG